MPIGASISHFIPDAKCMFRSNGLPAVKGPYVSEPLELARLVAKWRVNEFGMRYELPVWVNVGQAFFSDPTSTFVFALEVDVSAMFQQPVVVATYAYTPIAVNPFEVVMYPKTLEQVCRHATHLRLAVTPTPGADAIEFSAFPRGDIPKM